MVHNYKLKCRLPLALDNHMINNTAFLSKDEQKSTIDET